LSEPNADDELLALSIAQREETVPEAYHLRRRAPGTCQRPDLERTRALGGVHALPLKPGGREQPDED
jgi:hypothetical protein